MHLICYLLVNLFLCPCVQAVNCCIYRLLLYCPVQMYIVDMTCFYLGLKPHERWCRAVTFAICLLLLVISIAGLTTVILVPKANHQLQTITIQESVTTLVSIINAYYYDIRVSKTNDVICNVNISSTRCSDLQTYSMTYTGTFEAVDINSHYKLESLNDYAYLVSGSRVSIELNISLPSLYTSTDDNIFFYVFTDWESYDSFGQSQKNVKRYYSRYEVSNSVTTITFLVSDNGFYFYGLSFPEETSFMYSFNISRISYNSSKYETRCKLSSQMTSCLIRFDNTMFNQDQCVLSYCIGTNNSFYTLQNELIRKPITSGAAFIMSAIFILFVFLAALLLYDCYRRKLDPKLTTLDTCVCRRNQN